MDIEDALLGSTEDGELISQEQTLLNDITTQVEDILSGHQIADETMNTNLIELYINDVMGLDISAVDTLEEYVNTNDEIEAFDTVSQGLMDIFYEYIGINIDTSFDVVYFHHLYNLYIIFILDLKTTMINAVNKEVKIVTIENIINLINEDDYSPSEDFLQHAITNDLGNVAIDEIIKLLNHHIIFFDPVIFSNYVSSYVAESDIGDE